MLKQFYFIAEVAEILGISVASVQAHLARKRFDTVPAPTKLGRRLAWPVAVMDAFIKAKIEDCQQGRIKAEPVPASVILPKKIGRPSKREALRKAQEVKHA